MDRSCGKKLSIFCGTIYLLYYPPLPLFLTSFVFKLEFFVYILSILVTIFFIMTVRKQLIKSHIDSSFFMLMAFYFILVLYGGLNGILHNNDLVLLIKDVLFMIFPFVFAMFLGLTLNLKKFLCLFNSIIKVAELMVIIQVLVFAFLFVKFGLSFDFFWEFRYIYRNTGLLYTSFSFPVLWIIYILLKRKIFSRESILLMIGNLFTLGRVEFAFVVFILLNLFTYKLIKKCTEMRKLYYLILLISSHLAPFYYFLKAIQKDYMLEANLSNRWRLIEIQSYIYNVESGFFSIKDLVFGLGLGAKINTLKPLHMFTGEIYYSIDRFHNLFLFIFAKFGVIGIFLFVLIMDYLLFLSMKRNFFIFLFLIFYFFIKANVFGNFTMYLDIDFATIIYLLFTRGMKFVSR